MFDVIPTAFIFFAMAALLLVLPKGQIRSFATLVAPLLAAWHIWSLGFGSYASYEFFGFQLEAMRIDRLSRMFVLIFCLAAFIGNVFAWHVKGSVQQVAALFYAGSAVGAVLAGDMVTMFFFWEGTAIASVFLIWARGTEGAFNTGMRYLIIQIGSGVFLIGGVVLLYRETGSLAFEKMTLGSMGTWLIFIAFGIKCAFPLLHNWLQDSYPAATVSGTVILSAFTTKLAVYALARGFAGTEILIYIGTIMALFPIFFAEIENDLRRVLAYSMNNQLGFMVVGVGIGTDLAINGAASHLVAEILYKSLLFMSVGAVLYRTGTSKASEIGGLYRTMPLTAIFCLIGAISISAFPLTSGYVTKSLTLTAVAEGHYEFVWYCLIFASAGVLSHSGIKIPFFAFFAHDSGKRPAEAPRHMLVAMGIAAFFSIAIGVFPQYLYALLPYDVDYNANTMNHVMAQLQLLLFALLAFTFLFRNGIHPPEIRAINLDTDWTYRKAGPAVIYWLSWAVGSCYTWLVDLLTKATNRTIKRLYNSYGPEGRMARNWPTGAMVMSIAVLLAITLMVNLLI
jgi:multicomponent Na+:H+ antiporter subunit D